MRPAEMSDGVARNRRSEVVRQVTPGKRTRCRRPPVCGGDGGESAAWAPNEGLGDVMPGTQACTRRDGGHVYVACNFLQAQEAAFNP